MPIIELETRIETEIKTCFDLARSIELHSISTAKTKETAIGGITKGLINLGESVTWEATHFGIRQQLTSEITAFDFPFHFRDEQQKGIFKSIKHDHYFKQNGKIVIMKDIFDFESPFGYIGKVFNGIILTNYLKKFLIKRNEVIKAYAESDQWKTILNGGIYI